MKYKPYKNENDEKKAKKMFQEFPFYNVPIEKPCIKRLNNIYSLHELPFCNELGIIKTSKPLKGFARSYNIKMILTQNIH